MKKHKLNICTHKLNGPLDGKEYTCWMAIQTTWNAPP